MGEIGEIPLRELLAWAAYSRIEPWGEWRADVRAGIVASTIANVNLRQGARPFRPIDFMPFEERPPITEEEIEAKVSAFFRRWRI